MTRTPHLREFVVAIAAAVALGCGDSGLCASCPPVEGHYAIAFTNSSTSPDCAQLHDSLTPGTLALTRAGSQLSGSFNGTDGFSGIVDVGGNFSVAASSSDGGSNFDQQAFHGRYTAALIDGGTDRLLGTYNASYTRPANSRTCTLGASFSGARQ